MENKKSFILYTDTYEAIKDLSIEEKAQLLDAIFLYNINPDNPDNPDNPVGSLGSLGFGAKIAFGFLQQQFKRDIKKYKNIIERNRENGLKGGRPKNPNNPNNPDGYLGYPRKPKKPDSDSDNDNDILFKPHKKISYLSNPEFLKELEKLFPNRNVALEMERAKDWLASKGKVYKDYAAFARNWLRNESFSSENKNGLPQYKNTQADGVPIAEIMGYRTIPDRKSKETL